MGNGSNASKRHRAIAVSSGESQEPIQTFIQTVTHRGTIHQDKPLLAQTVQTQLARHFSALMAFDRSCLFENTSSTESCSSYRPRSASTRSPSFVSIRLYIDMSSRTDSWDGRDHFSQLELVQYRDQPAASRPTKRMLISILPQRRLKTLEKAIPMIADLSSWRLYIGRRPSFATGILIVSCASEDTKTCYSLGILH
uniref:Uncharacterized protein n=1 Tax=Hyaloperonospora arabidopsidis (strain Emoy2) TaxID=559515 RepID=M4BNV7_HYAAE